MSFLRTARISLRASPILPRAHQRIVAFNPIQQQRYATQDYGSGDGNPAGENPKSQGVSKVARDLEHPGPEAPSVGGSGGDSAEGKTGEADDANRKSNRQREIEMLHDKGGSAPQPKIHSENPPKEGEQSADVEKHNAEMKERKV